MNNLGDFFFFFFFLKLNLSSFIFGYAPKTTNVNLMVQWSLNKKHTALQVEIVTFDCCIFMVFGEKYYKHIQSNYNSVVFKVN